MLTLFLVPKSKSSPATRVRPLLCAAHLYNERDIRRLPTASRTRIITRLERLVTFRSSINSTANLLKMRSLYLKEDAQFVPVKSTNDIPQRNEWDKARFKAYMNWMDEHMPKFIDLGEVADLPLGGAQPSQSGRSRRLDLCDSGFQKS